MLGLTADQRRAELDLRIRLISARTGITHTRAFRWGMELVLSDAARARAQTQAQASVREVHLPLIHFLLFKLIEQLVRGS
jgi:hypothetical protein